MVKPFLSHSSIWFIFVLLIFLGMLLFLEMGLRWGKRQLAIDSKARKGLSGIEAAVYSLFGLLIAFTFSGAAERFDHRKVMIVEEANAIGTAYLRLDLLPEPSRSEEKEMFRRYLSLRLEAYRSLPDLPAAMAKIADSEKVQLEIWSKMVANCEAKAPACAMLVVPAINSMFDLANSRLLATQLHPPTIIFIMLILLGLACAFMAGFAMAEEKNKKHLYSILFPLIIAFTLYIILDLEFPRIGFIKVSDIALERVLNDMH